MNAQNVHRTSWSTAPSQTFSNALFASKDAHHKLEKLAESYPEHKDEVKKIFIRSTTTKPPIVWFPGDPDCGEDGGQDGTMDTFQLIAFLLSAFNIASLMVSNVNNNNNNNNINDNIDNANDNSINESNTNAQVMSMTMIGLGGRKLNVTKRSLKEEHRWREHFLKSNYTRYDHEENLPPVLREALTLVFKSLLSPSTACLQKLVCQSSEAMSRSGGGGVAHVLAEVYSSAIVANIPHISKEQKRRILEAAAVGRLGRPCSQFKECEEINWSFIHNAEQFPSSTVGNFNHVYSLLHWVYNKL